MKNKFKGFTLVELIVVMAIMSIIMAGVMQLFTPMRTIFVDTTQYEAQRSAQNGVVKYITESVRFSADLGIYNNTITSAADAVDAFATQYCTSYGVDSAKETAVKDAIKKHAEVIIIANDSGNSHRYASKTYTGRLIRRKGVGTATSVPADPALNSSAYTDDWRIAMGEAYYGANTFSIALSATGTDGMLNIAVSSSRNSKRDISNAATDTSAVTPNVNKGGVLCRNLLNGGNGVAGAGMFDVSKYNGNSVTSGTKTYIVFLNVGSKTEGATPTDPPVYSGKQAVLQAAK